jgi:hypothetical protein
MKDFLNSAERDDERAEYVPSPAAVALTLLVLLFSLAIFAIAAYEISHSRGWQLAPAFLQRALRQN